MKKLKIAHQLFALIGVLMAAFAVATYFEIRTSEQAIYDERFDMLRTQVESGISILNTFHEREKAGQMTHEAAQAEAFEILKRVSFQPSGYLFGFDYNVVQLFHPSPVNLGKNMSGQVDKTGAKFSQALVDNGKAGGGRTFYYWTKPGQPEDQVFLKGGYSKAFEPWKIVVGTGVYLDDLQQKVNATIWKALTASLIVFVCGIAAAVFFIRGISHPLKDIHNALQSVAEEDVSIAIPHIGMNNEVGMMAKATQSLQEKIRERHAMSDREAAQHLALESERENNLRQQQDEAT
ncbi:cache domain-containing protein, partial [Rhizobium leguminosarum]|uniref:cache domain-containing protein n=1 Tax=Rhizobium leguminosarum TaxID=384 RepID=UPI003F9E335C